MQKFMVTIILMMSIVPLHAGVNVWTTTGPLGGEVTCVAVAVPPARIIYIGTTTDGILKSNDEGKS